MIAPSGRALRQVSQGMQGSRGGSEGEPGQGILRLGAGCCGWGRGCCCLRPNWSCSKAAAGKMNLYESFAQATQLGDLHTCLMMDMKACQEDDVRLLCHLTPSIYTEVSGCPRPHGQCRVGS